MRRPFKHYADGDETSSSAILGESPFLAEAFRNGPENLSGESGAHSVPGLWMRYTDADNESPFLGEVLSATEADHESPSVGLPSPGRLGVSLGAEIPGVSEQWQGPLAALLKSLAIIGSRVPEAVRSEIERTAVAMAVSGGQRNPDIITDLIFQSRHPEFGRPRVSASDAALVAKWKALRAGLVQPIVEPVANPEVSSGTVPSPGGRNFSVNAGVVLTPSLESFARDLSTAFMRRTGKQIHVTSGVRTPEAQAKAMWTKLAENEDLTKLYRNKTAVNEVIAVAKGQAASAAIPAMMSVLEAQMSRGVYLSGHMRSNSIDVRSKTLSETEKRAFDAAVAELGARLLYEGVPPHFHVNMPPAVPAREAPPYWSHAGETWEESEAVVEREDECLLGNPDDLETFENADAFAETAQDLIEEGEASFAVPAGLNTFRLKSGELRTLPDGSTLFNNAGTLLWTPREAKVIGLREPVRIMPDGQGQAVLWPANVPAPKSADLIEFGRPHLFLQAQFYLLKFKWTSDQPKDFDVSLRGKLSDKLEIAVSEPNVAKLTASTDVPLSGPVYVGFAGAIDSTAQLKGQSQVGVKAGTGPIKVKAGVEVEVRAKLDELMVAVGEKTLPLEDAIRKKIIDVTGWDKVIEPFKGAYQGVFGVGNEISHETGSSPVVLGSNAFGAVFQNTATGRSDVNAYLLAYLATVVYADRIWWALPEAKSLSKEARDRFEVFLQTNPRLFQEKFDKCTRPLFFSAARPISATNAPPRYDFVWDQFQGFDPEAMVIETATSVFVVFRGTDRVGGFKSGFNYDWAEWVSTDANVKLSSPGHGIRGNVHSGIWLSLSLIKDKLASKIVEFGGKKKKVWITGHSLGAGQAQLFAGFLSAEHQIQAQGVYAFASPRVGDEEFVAGLNSRFPKSEGRLQRFEFVNDPVPVMPSRISGYRDAGLRNYYDTIWKYKFDAGERDALDDSKFAVPSNFCFHHPTWYLRAAYAQLEKSDKERLPPFLNIPDADAEACGARELARAMSR